MSHRENPFNRRGFLRITTATAAASALGVPTIIPRSVLAQGSRPGANDRVIVGCVSGGYRARLLMEQLPEAATLVAVADCNLPQVLQYKKEKQADRAVYGSHYALLDHRDIDAVIITGQEYQRVLPCIHAVQAGKDVYAEKPLTLYIQEGRTLIDHVRKHQACHLNNITRWMDRELKFDPKTERFIDAADANAWNDRPRRAGYELPKVQEGGAAHVGRHRRLPREWGTGESSRGHERVLPASADIARNTHVPGHHARRKRCRSNA